jgi:large subunit ribosomal protein L18
MSEENKVRRPNNFFIAVKEIFIMKFSKTARRKKIQLRIRKKINGSASLPRLSVFRSNKEIYAQLIDDKKGVTLVAASSREASVSKSVNKTEQAKEVGKSLAEKAKAENIANVVFDRGGYLYHGRVKALADGAREAGLQF